MYRATKLEASMLVAALGKGKRMKLYARALLPANKLQFKGLRSKTFTYAEVRDQCVYLAHTGGIAYIKNEHVDIW